MTSRRWYRWNVVCTTRFILSEATRNSIAMSCWSISTTEPSMSTVTGPGTATASPTCWRPWEAEIPEPFCLIFFICPIPMRTPSDTPASWPTRCHGCKTWFCHTRSAARNSAPPESRHHRNCIPFPSRSMMISGSSMKAVRFWPTRYSCRPTSYAKSPAGWVSGCPVTTRTARCAGNRWPCTMRGTITHPSNS